MLKAACLRLELTAPMLLPGLALTRPCKHLLRQIQLMRCDGKRWVPQG